MLGMTKGEKEGILPHSLRSLVRMTRKMQITLPQNDGGGNEILRYDLTSSRKRVRCPLTLSLRATAGSVAVLMF